MALVALTGSVSGGADHHELAGHDVERRLGRDLAGVQVDGQDAVLRGLRHVRDVSGDAQARVRLLPLFGALPRLDDCLLYTSPSPRDS